MDLICPLCKTVNTDIKIDDILKKRKCVSCGGVMR